MAIQIKETVKKVVAPLLEPHGFKLDPTKPNFTFTRRVGDVDQRVQFDKGTTPPKVLRLYLDTSVDEDQHTLELSLLEMVQLVLELGLKWLDVASTPIPEIPTEVEETLNVDPTGRAEKFAGDHGFPLTDPGSLRDVEDFLIKEKCNSSEGNWELLLNASAFFGEYVIRGLGGYWEWDSINSKTSIRGMGGKPLMKSSVIPIIVLFLYRHPFKSLQDIWEAFREDANSPYHYV